MESAAFARATELPGRGKIEKEQLKTVAKIEGSAWMAISAEFPKLVQLAGLCRESPPSSRTN